MNQGNTSAQSRSSAVAAGGLQDGAGAPEFLVPPGTWAIDAQRSRVSFDVRHLKVLRTRGCFASFEGNVVCAGEGTVDISAAVSVASIETDDSKRDERLREADFFDVEQHPVISYEGVATPLRADGPFEVRGRLTIKGVARKIVLSAWRLPADPSAGDAVRIRAEGSVSRRDFGLDWEPAFAAGGLVLDDLVHVVLDVVAVRSLT